MTDIIENLKKGQSLTFEESKSLFSGLMEGKFKENTIIEILEALSKKGETKDEILQVMDDLKSADVDFLTIGQYLQPSVKHFPLDRYYKPQEFEELGAIAKAKGFLLVSSSPLTRSSYHADEDFAKLQQNRNNLH